MLVLKRKDGERVRIGENIWVTVTKCHSGRASLKIEAPAEVQVVRGELIGTPAGQRIDRQQQQIQQPQMQQQIQPIRGRECA